MQVEVKVEPSVWRGGGPAHPQLILWAVAVLGHLDRAVQKHRVTWYHLFTEKAEAQKGQQRLHSPARVTPTLAPSISSQRAGEFALSLWVSCGGKVGLAKPGLETGRWPGTGLETVMESTLSPQSCSPANLPRVVPSSELSFVCALYSEPRRRRPPVVASVWSLHHLSC